MFWPALVVLAERGASRRNVARLPPQIIPIFRKTPLYVFCPPPPFRSTHKIIAEAMLAEQWDPAQRLVSCAVLGPDRQALARALIPAASEAEAYNVAQALIKDNSLEAEFANLGDLQVCFCFCFCFDFFYARTAGCAGYEVERGLLCGKG